MKNGNDPKLRLSDRRAAKRKRQQRDAMRAADFKPMQYWVHTDDCARVKRLVAKLRKARIGDEGDT